MYTAKEARTATTAHIENEQRIQEAKVLEWLETSVYPEIEKLANEGYWKLTLRLESSCTAAANRACDCLIESGYRVKLSRVGVGEFTFAIYW